MNAKVLIQERSPGRWRVRIETMGGDGKRKFAYETVKGTKDDAERRRLEILKSDESGSWIEPSKLTFGAFWETYLEQRHSLDKICRGTAESYERLISANVLPAFGGHRLQRITGVQIQALYTQLRTRKDRRQLAPSTIRLAHVILKTAFNYAVKQGLIVVNPMARVEVPSLRRAVEGKANAKALDVAQVERLLREIAGDWKEPYVHVALGTGMRRGELCGLRWGCVDLDAGKLLVAAQLVQYKDGTVEYKVPKTRSGRRTLMISGPVVDVLRPLRMKAAAESLAAGRGSIDDVYVFSRDGVNPLKPDTIGPAFSDFCDGIGLPHFTLHGTRHTHITALLKHAGEHGAKAVSERAGHTTVAFTLDRYQTVFEADDSELAEVGGRLLKPAARE